MWQKFLKHWVDECCKNKQPNKLYQFNHVILNFSEIS